MSGPIWAWSGAGLGLAANCPVPLGGTLVSAATGFGLAHFRTIARKCFVDFQRAKGALHLLRPVARAVIVLPEEDRVDDPPPFEPSPRFAFHMRPRRQCLCRRSVKDNRIDAAADQPDHVRREALENIERALHGQYPSSVKSAGIGSISRSAFAAKTIRVSTAAASCPKAKHAGASITVRLLSDAIHEKSVGPLCQR